jgi:hypothetical protein
MESLLVSKDPNDPYQPTLMARPSSGTASIPRTQLLASFGFLVHRPRLIRLPVFFSLLVEKRFELPPRDQG